MHVVAAAARSAIVRGSRAAGGSLHASSRSILLSAPSMTLGATPISAGRAGVKLASCGGRTAASLGLPPAFLLPARARLGARAVAAAFPALGVPSNACSIVAEDGTSVAAVAEVCALEQADGDDEDTLLWSKYVDTGPPWHARRSTVALSSHPRGGARCFSTSVAPSGEDAFEDHASAASNTPLILLPPGTLNPAFVERLQSAGIDALFPVQEATLPVVMAGEDVLVRSRTGSGKTLAFAIPIIELLLRDAPTRVGKGKGLRPLPRCLVVVPTRELAKQVETEFKRIAGPLRVISVYGGVAYGPQREALRGGVDIIVGTPGRLLDAMSSSDLNLSAIRVAVLDEADEMLRMGFKEDVEKLFEAMPSATPPATGAVPDAEGAVASHPRRITMLWSATVPDWVRRLASEYCHAPRFVDLVGDNAHKLPSSAEFVVHMVTEGSRAAAFASLASSAARTGAQFLVFTETKREAGELALSLPTGDHVRLAALTGDLSQSQREQALAEFRKGKLHGLCATDVAARGLDIPSTDLVVHYRLPRFQEAFVHRSGRTARAGKTGRIALLLTRKELPLLARWQRELKFTAVTEAVPRQDAEELIATNSAAVTAALARVPTSVMASAHVDALMARAAPGSTDAMLRRALTLLALQHSDDAEARTFSSFAASLLNGEVGRVTLMLSTGSPACEQLAQALKLPNAPADATAAAAWLPHLLEACEVPELRRPTRVLACDEGLVFDLPRNLASDMLQRAAVAGGALSELRRLPAQVQRALESSSRSDGAGYERGSGGGERGFERSRDRERGSSRGGGFRGGYRGGEHSSASSSRPYRERSASFDGDASPRRRFSRDLEGGQDARPRRSRDEDAGSNERTPRAGVDRWDAAADRNGGRDERRSRRSDSGDAFRAPRRPSRSADGALNGRMPFAASSDQPRVKRSMYA